MVAKKKNTVIKNKNFVKKNSSKPKVVYKEDYSGAKNTPAKKIKWNFSVNDLIMFKNTNQIGLIISDDEYVNAVVESNFYFVLTNNRVIKAFGGSLKKIR